MTSLKATSNEQERRIENLCDLEGNFANLSDIEASFKKLGGNFNKDYQKEHHLLVHYVSELVFNQRWTAKRLKLVTDYIIKNNKYPTLKVVDFQKAVPNSPKIYPDEIYYSIKDKIPNIKLVSYIHENKIYWSEKDDLPLERRKLTVRTFQTPVNEPTPEEEQRNKNLIESFSEAEHWRKRYYILQTDHNILKSKCERLEDKFKRLESITEQIYKEEKYHQLESALLAKTMEADGLRKTLISLGYTQFKLKKAG